MELLNYVWFCVCLRLEELLIAGAVMVSIVIAILGLAKPALKRLIKNEELCKSAIAFSSIILSFGVTAGYFLIRPINWDLYWLASLITSAACILTYWVYEYVPYLRTGVHKLLHFIIDKTAHILNMIVDGKSPEEVKSEIQKATKELKATAKSELKSVSNKSYKKDKDLKNV